MITPTTPTHHITSQYVTYVTQNWWLALSANTEREQNVRKQTRYTDASRRNLEYTTLTKEAQDAGEKVPKEHFCED